MKALFLGLFWSTFIIESNVMANLDEPKSLVLNAIGDSITTGFNSRNLGDNWDLSWATAGLPEVMSHRQRLELSGFQVTSINSSIAGSKAGDLPPQIDEVIQNGGDYVPVTIGANDLCSWPVDHEGALEAFREKVIGEMSRLIEARPEVTIILTPIPDLFNLWEVAHKQSQCQSRWDFFNICAPLLNSRRTADERESFRTRWNDANNALEAIASEFPKNIYFPKEVAATKFEMRHISSIDCFHPSVQGQNLLAELSWPDQPIEQP